MALACQACNATVVLRAGAATLKGAPPGFGGTTQRSFEGAVPPGMALLQRLQMGGAAGMPFGLRDDQSGIDSSLHFDERKSHPSRMTEDIILFCHIPLPLLLFFPHFCCVQVHAGFATDAYSLLADLPGMYSTS